MVSFQISHQTHKIDLARFAAPTDNQVTVTEPLSIGSPANRQEEVKEPALDTLSSTETATVMQREKTNIIRNLETGEESQQESDEASLADAIKDD